VRPSSFVFLWRARKSNAQSKTDSVVVKDLRFKDEDKDKESSFKDKDNNKDKDLMSKDDDKDEDLKIGPRGQQHCKHRVSKKRPRLLEIQNCQSTSHTLVTS